MVGKLKKKINERLDNDKKKLFHRTFNPNSQQAFHRHPAEYSKMQQDPPARTMVYLFSAEVNKIQQLSHFCCILLH